ncbi:MAG: hypothetical protein ABJC04_06940 [Verrucomicrobiota bacterium]
MRIFICTLAAALLFSGCSLWPFSRKNKKTASEMIDPSRPVVVPANSDSGKVASVNTNGRFVVMTFPIGSVPKEDRRVNIFRNGLKVAEVRITGPQRDNNTVGDIISGEAQVNDDVRF